MTEEPSVCPRVCPVCRSPFLLVCSELTTRAVVASPVLPRRRDPHPRARSTHPRVGVMFSSSPDSLFFRARLAVAVAVSRAAESVSVSLPHPDALRHWLGFFAVAFTFGVLPYWLSLHSLVGLWRRLGPGPTVALHAAAVVGVLRVFVAEPVRTSMMGTLGGDLGAPSPAALTLAAVLAVCSVRLKLAWWREMDLGTACGWRGELEPDGVGGRLVTSGVYSVCRHPRYGQLLIGLTSVTLVANHVVAWAALAAAVVLFTAIAKLEDDELRARFGEAHEAYAFSVPSAFFPNPLPFLLQMSQDTRAAPARLKRKRSVGAAARPREAEDDDGEGEAANGNGALSAEQVDDATDNSTEDAVPDLTTPHSKFIVAHTDEPPGPVPDSPDPWAFTETDGAVATSLDAAELPDAEELYSSTLGSKTVEAGQRMRR